MVSMCFVEAPSGCDPLSLQLAPSGIFSLSSSAFEGYITTEDISEDAERKLYQLQLDAETQSFTNDEWCIRVSTNGSCENYELSASFTRRQLVCSDLREPNNNINQAVQLDQDGPLADGSGYIAYDQDVRLNENMLLCQGDQDIFTVRSTAGDAWRRGLVD